MQFKKKKRVRKETVKGEEVMQQQEKSFGVKVKCNVRIHNYEPRNLKQPCTFQR